MFQAIVIDEMSSARVSETRLARDKEEESLSYVFLPSSLVMAVWVVLNVHVVQRQSWTHPREICVEKSDLDKECRI